MRYRAPTLGHKRPISLLFLALLGVAAGTGCPHGHDAASAKKSNDRLDIAKDFLRKHELEAAEAEANKAIGYLSTNEDAYDVRGLIRYLHALDAQRLLEIDGCLTGVDAEALRKELDGDLAKADADFKKAAELAPDFGEAWSNRGVVATLEGSYGDAIDYLHHALQSPARLLNPGLTRAHLGWAYFHKGDLVQAAKELLQAVQFQPGMCVASYRLGRVYFARKEWEKAAEQFQGVSEQQACGSQEARLYLMKTRIEQGLVGEARSAREACLSLSPKSCVAIRCRTEGAQLGSAPP